MPSPFEKPYQPSPEEIKKAEEIMTEEQIETSEKREQKLSEDAYLLFEFIKRSEIENLSDAEISLFNQLVKYFHIPETDEFDQLTPKKQQEARDRMDFLHGIAQKQTFKQLLEEYHKKLQAR